MQSKLLILAAAAVACVSPVVMAAPAYTIQLLDSSGADDVYVKGINNAGQAVGWTVDSLGTHAAMWDSAGVHYLDGVNSGFSFSKAFRINNNGEIVGLSQADASFNHATYWSPALAPTDIGTLTGAGGSFANDINDNGIVVGSSTATRGQHAFTWTSGGGIVDWGSFNSNVNAEVAGFNAINNNGLMGGTHYYFSDPYKGMIADYNDRDHTLTNVSPLGPRFTQGMVFAINDAGTIVGYQNHGSGDGFAAIFHPEDMTFTDLGDLGLGASRAYDINELGIIVGEAYGDDQKAFVYADGTMYDLSTLITNYDGWQLLFDASAVNDNGVIVGSGVLNGQIVGYMLTPVTVPEPTSLAAIAIGAGAMLRRRRR